MKEKRKRPLDKFAKTLDNICTIGQILCFITLFILVILSFARPSAIMRNTQGINLKRQRSNKERPL